MKLLKKILAMFGGFCIGAGGLVLLAGVPLASVDWKSLDLSAIRGLRAYVVLSGSMEPAVKIGSVVFSLPYHNYQVGDIVTFSQNKTFVTHRLTQTTIADDGALTYQTKGDANKTVDTSNVAGSDIVGKAILSVPYLGYVVEFAKKPVGFILLVVVPATIIIYEELKSLLRELRKILKRLSVYVKSKIRKKPTVLLADIPKEHAFPKAILMIPIAAGALFLVTRTSAVYLDQELSQLNLLQASDSFERDEFRSSAAISPLAQEVIVEPTPSPTVEPSPSPVIEESPVASPIPLLLEAEIL